MTRRAKSVCCATAEARFTSRLLILALAISLAHSANAQPRASQKTAAKPAVKEAVSVESALAESIKRAQGIADPPQKSAALAKIIEVQIKMGRLAEAHQTIWLIPSSEDRARAFSQVAFAEAEAGKLDAAFATADLATRGESTGLKVSLSEQQQRDYKNMVLRGIASARAAAGDVEGIRRAESAAILSGDIANKFLREIARAQVKSGDVAAAEKSFAEYFRSMPDSGTSTDPASLASASVAAAQLEFGDLVGVLASAARVRDGAAQATILAGAAKAQAEHGDRATATATIARALAAAQAYRDLYGYDKSRAFLEIAKAQSALGDFRGAQDTARQISDGFTKTQAFTAIAIAQARAGDVPGAMQTANSIVNDAAATNHEDAIKEIAVAQADAGNITGARATLAQLPAGYDTNTVTAAIAIAQAHAGDYKTALATSDQLPESDRRAWSLRIFAVRGIARVQTEAGDAAGAKEWIATLNAPALETSGLLGVAEGLVPGK
jgi:tetratricopeptide (TPR) repeat protein